MSDRLTQLQDMINQQAEYFCNSIGILQQFSTPSKFPEYDKVGSRQQNPVGDQDYASLFASLITKTAKDIDALIECLPSDDISLDAQVQSLQFLEEENQEACQQLEEKVQQGEAMLAMIQAALQDIAQSQLDTQNITSDTYENSNSNLMAGPIKQEKENPSNDNQQNKESYTDMIQ